MKNGFTLIELLVSMAVGIIALGAIVFMMNQFIFWGPKILTKINQAQEEIVINERIQSQLLKMGPSISSITIDPSGKWISYQVQVPFGQNGIYYTPYTQIATITMKASSIVLNFRNINDPISQTQSATIASGVTSLYFYPATSGSVKYTFTLSKNGITSSYTSAVTSMNLR